MSLDQEVEALRKVPFFANIDPARLKLMAFASERLTFKPGQMLCKPDLASMTSSVKSPYFATCRAPPMSRPVRKVPLP